MRAHSAGARTVRHWGFRYCEDRPHPVGISNVEKHPFRDDAAHGAMSQVHDEQRLLAYDLLWILSLQLQAGDDGAGVIAEVDPKLHQLCRAIDVRHRFDGAYAHID